MRAKQYYGIALAAMVIACGASLGLLAIGSPPLSKSVPDLIGPLVLEPAEYGPAIRRKAVRSELAEAIMYFRQNTCDGEERRIVALKLEQYFDTRDAKQATFFRPWGKSERELEILWGTPLDLELKQAIRLFVQDGDLAMDDFSRYRAIFGLRYRKGDWWKKHRCYQ